MRHHREDMRRRMWRRLLACSSSNPTIADLREWNISRDNYEINWHSLNAEGRATNRISQPGQYFYSNVVTTPNIMPNISEVEETCGKICDQLNATVIW
jgi:hypothetical protein